MNLASISECNLEAKGIDQFLFFFQSSPPPPEKEQAQIRSPPEKLVPAEPPKVNVWAQRKQEREEATKQRQDSSGGTGKTDLNATDDEKLMEASPGSGRGQRPVRDREARGRRPGV